MGGGNERGFVGRGAKRDAAFQHAVEEGFEAVGVGRGHIGVALREAVGEVEAEHAADAVGREGHASLLRGGGEAASELLAGSA